MKTLTLLLLCSLATAQNFPKPTELQQTKLESKKKDVVIYQTEEQSLQTQLGFVQNQKAQAFQDLQTYCKQIVKENNWPDTVDCDPNTLTFSNPPPAPKPEGNNPKPAAIVPPKPEVKK